MGSSGAGKTTLVDIILGLIKPDSGEMLINGKKLDSDKNWNLQVAYLPQEIFLLDASIKTNISFETDDKLIDLDKINNALENAQLKDMIESQPNGIDTIIGENGIKVSGGQKQRLAIARAFYHGRDILIMDEATSALDYETEKEIIDVLNTIKKNKTLIVIAHRMSTLKHCDKIFEIKNGKLNQKKII
jgi:ABC-type bacteriocin/lantibiotic exporter with double-glycine peptidase domain